MSATELKFASSTRHPKTAAVNRLAAFVLQIPEQRCPGFFALFLLLSYLLTDLAVGQNPVPLVNIKLGGTWVFIRPKMEP